MRFSRVPVTLRMHEIRNDDGLSLCCVSVGVKFLNSGDLLDGRAVAVVCHGMEPWEQARMDRWGAEFTMTCNGLGKSEALFMVPDGSERISYVRAAQVVSDLGVKIGEPFRVLLSPVVKTFALSRGPETWDIRDEESNRFLRFICTDEADAFWPHTMDFAQARLIVSHEPMENAIHFLVVETHDVIYLELEDGSDYCVFGAAASEMRRMGLCPGLDCWVRLEAVR